MLEQIKETNPEMYKGLVEEIGKDKMDHMSDLSRDIKR